MSLGWYYIAENATAGDQQMIGRQGRLIYGHFGYEPLVLLQYREILLPMIVLSALLCKKDPVLSSVRAQVVNKGSPRLTHVVAFVL